MLKLFLWLRYLHKIRIVFLSITAIALSVALLIVVADLFTGFIKAFEEAAVQAIGDVVIIPRVNIPKYDLLTERLEESDIVEGATAILPGSGLLHLDMGNVRAVTILGIDLPSRIRATGFDRFLLQQRDGKTIPSFESPDDPEETGGFIGVGLVSIPDEKTDQYDYDKAMDMLNKKITLTTGAVSVSQQDSDRTEPKRLVLQFIVTDIVETGIYQFDSSYVYLPIEELSRTLYPDLAEPVAQQIQIKLRDGVDTDIAIAQINGIWRNFVEEQLNSDVFLLRFYSVYTSLELQSEYIIEFQKQMGVLLVVFNIISFGAVLLVFCILYMIVRIKRKDIAILKSCGSSDSSIAAIFVGFGAFIGVVGSGLGIVLGYIITRNINTIEQWIRIIFGIKLWKRSVYFFSTIPNDVDWSWVVVITVLAIAAASIGALIPAVVAAMTKPVDILRYE